MNLIIDIGNTKAKIALFEQGEVVYFETFKYAHVLNTVNYILDTYKVTKSIISSVGNKIDGLNEMLDESTYFIKLTNNTHLPITIDYETPDTLGVDRIALAVGAYLIADNKNSLIIDMGTCITYDFIDAKGVYRGGAISPGMNMRFKAMNNFTDSLPLISYKEPHSILGKNTETSLINGVFFGIKSEIDGYISSIKGEHENISIIITGGDASFFVNKLKNSIFADQKILMRGLNQILNYNFKKQK